MVSRRNLIIILITMGAIFFLFQFSQIMKDQGNHYSHNRYANLEIAKNHAWSQEGSADNWKDGEYVLFLGGKTAGVSSIVTQWANYSKRNLATVSSLSEYSKSGFHKPEFVIVDSANVNYDTDTANFLEMVDAGISMVFCNLPDAKLIESNPDLMKLFGITTVKEYEVEVEGYDLFGGFLLGGEVIYKPRKENEEKRQDLDLTLPWYITTGGTKTYMVGIMDEYFQDYELKNDYVPAVIWRTSFGDAQVFCVNGDYMQDTAGLGILSSMIYELSSYQLYPVVNAQNTLVVDFPLMANENDREIQGLYARNAETFQFGVAWPTLVAFARQNKLVFTCLLAPKYDYSDEAPARADYYVDYLKMFNEEKAEIGASMEYVNASSVDAKAASDQEFYDTLELKYQMTSAYCDLQDIKNIEQTLAKYPYLKNVRTVACDEDINVPILSYLTKDITLQSLTSDTKNFFYSRDLMLKSVETALGYDNAALNFSEVMWPKSEADHWENIYDDMSSSLNTYWKPFRSFDQTTLTESDQRVRTFLNLSCTSTRTDNVITLQVSGRDNQTAYFLLRTHGEAISYVEGGTYKKLEENAYLIAVTSDEVTIKVRSTNGSVNIQ